MDGQQYVEATSLAAIAGSMNWFDGSVVLDDGLNIKVEPGDTDLDIGPTVLQHMDTHYGTKQLDTSVVKQESTIINNYINPILFGGVKEEIIEDEQSDAQHSKKDIQSEHRAPPYRCDKCPKMYKYKRNRKRVHETENHACTECGIKYKYKGCLIRHIRKVHCKQKYEYTIGKNMYKSKETLREHVLEPRIFICDYCRKTFSAINNIRTHISCVHASSSYKCSQCNKRFKCEQYLTWHVAQTHTAYRKACDVCGKSVRPSGLRRHMRDVHRDTQCTLCGETMKSKEDLHLHLTNRHRSADAQFGKEETQIESQAQSRPYKCDMCPKTYKYSRGLTRHCKGEHDAVSHECTKCKVSYKCKESLMRHVRNSHSEQQYPCTICKKMCNSKEALCEHVVRCHGCKSADAQFGKEETQIESQAQSRLYKCDMCPKTYKYSWGLTRHCKGEHDAVSHECTKCKVSYKYKESLMRHMRSNTHSKQQYPCTICKKMCKSKVALREHVVRCHGRKSAGSPGQIFTCDYCQKTFWRKPELRGHVVGVHGVRVHRCRRCKKVFKSRNYLLKHETNFHDQAQHECEVCARRYTTRNKLDVHFERAHSSNGVQVKSVSRPRESAMSDSSLVAADVGTVANTGVRDVVVVKEEPGDGTRWNWAQSYSSTWIVTTDHTRRNHGSPDVD